MLVGRYSALHDVNVLHPAYLRGALLWFASALCFYDSQSTARDVQNNSSEAGSECEAKRGYAFNPIVKMALFRHFSFDYGDPYGNRTRVSAVKGPRPNR